MNGPLMEKNCQQECIPVGCVPSATVAVCWPGECVPPPHTPEQAPLGAGTPPGDLLQGMLGYHLQGMLGYQPPGDLLQGILGYHLQGMLGYQPQTCCKAYWDITCKACWDTTPPSPPCGQTHTCKNITFATSLRTVTRYIPTDGMSF